jgi:hypothetical protein
MVKIITIRKSLKPINITLTEFLFSFQITQYRLNKNYKGQTTFLYPVTRYSIPVLQKNKIIYYDFFKFGEFMRSATYFF